MSEKYELPPDVVLSQGEEWAWKHAIVKEFIKEALSRGFKDGRESMQAERDAAIARAEKLKATVGVLIDALVAIVDRADNGELGTSKVQDMARIARAALAGKEPAYD